MSWFDRGQTKTPEQDQIQAVRKEWQFQLDNAVNKADRREINEIFRRHLESLGI